MKFRWWDGRPGNVVHTTGRTYVVADDCSWRRVVSLGPPLILYDRKNKPRKKERVANQRRVREMDRRRAER